MSKKAFTFLILFLLSYTVSALADDENLNHNESIGGLRTEGSVEDPLFNAFLHNRERLHSSNGYLSPVDYELQCKAA